MKFFLAKIDYIVTQYMGDDEFKSEFYIVIAKDENQAREKAEKYIDDQTVQYSCYYRVQNVDITQAIE